MLKKIFYLFLLFVLIKCNNKSDIELYDSARKNVSEENLAEAIEDYKSLISEHEESPLRLQAMIELAEKYGQNIDKSLSDEENLKKAVDLYYNAHKDYPDSIKAINSLFMAAYIHHNLLNNLDEAKRIYEEFIKKYPQSDLADDASAELDNLGLTPEEILKKNQMQGKFETN